MQDVMISPAHLHHCLCLVPIADTFLSPQFYFQIFKNTWEFPEQVEKHHSDATVNIFNKPLNHAVHRSSVDKTFWSRKSRHITANANTQGNVPSFPRQEGGVSGREVLGEKGFRIVGDDEGVDAEVCWYKPTIWLKDGVGNCINSTLVGILDSSIVGSIRCYLGGSWTSRMLLFTVLCLSVPHLSTVFHIQG